MTIFVVFGGIASGRRLVLSRYKGWRARREARVGYCGSSGESQHTRMVGLGAPSAKPASRAAIDAGSGIARPRGEVVYDPQLNRIAGTLRDSFFPDKFAVEICADCNLACTMCHHPEMKPTEGQDALRAVGAMRRPDRRDLAGYPVLVFLLWRTPHGTRVCFCGSWPTGNRWGCAR